MSKGILQIYIINFLIVLSIPAFSQAEDTGTVIHTDKNKFKRVSIEAGPEAYFGYTQYRIGGLINYPDGTRVRTWFPLSELKFPLKVYMISGELKLMPGESFFIKANIKKNITRKAGKMEDSDWGVETGISNSLDIFSKSDAKLDAFIVNSDFQIRIFSSGNFSLFAGAGFLYQNFKFDVSNVDQTYPSTAPEHHDFVSGKVLTYKIEYYMPYAEIAPVFSNSRISISPCLAIAPYIIAKDVDDHLLRYKKSKGDSRGSSFMASLKTELSLIGAVFFSLDFNYIYIYARGHQKQYQYRTSYDRNGNVIPVGPIGKIENEIKSSQFSAGANIGIHF